MQATSKLELVYNNKIILLACAHIANKKSYMSVVHRLKINPERTVHFAFILGQVAYVDVNSEWIINISLKIALLNTALGYSNVPSLYNILTQDTLTL